MFTDVRKSNEIPEMDYSVYIHREHESVNVNCGCEIKPTDANEFFESSSDPKEYDRNLQALTLKIEKLLC